jgi:transcriptional repressor NrdR
MKCPKCNHIESKVIDSRPAEDLKTIRRRRECLECKYRFTTYERLESVPLFVVKRDGTREEYDRNKCIRGLVKACEKRPVSMEQIENLVSDAETELFATSENEISSTRIGEAIMNRLKHMDDVAYVRFASVYRQFKDLNTFVVELELLLKERDRNKM